MTGRSNERASTAVLGSDGQLMGLEPVRDDSGAAQAASEMMGEAVSRILVENAALCKNLADVSRQLDQSRLLEERLAVTCAASSAVCGQQKLDSLGLSTSRQQSLHTERQKLTESALRAGALQDVYRRLQGIHRQLSLAVELQAQHLTDCDNRFIARSGRVQRLERAIYRIVAEAQRESGLESALTSLIDRCGPTVRGVLSFEAQRQAMELVVHGG